MSDETTQDRISRRAFLGKVGSSAVGLLALNGCRHLPAVFDPPPPDLPVHERRVWLWADSHNGLPKGGKDGAQWAELSLREMQKNLPPPDYTLVLGDITHRYKPEEFRAYHRLRAMSGWPRWYELAGNHDFNGTTSGDYQRYVRSEERYVLVDGNLAWIFVSAERGMSDGIVRPPTRRWLPEVLAKHQDKNVIVCTHQLVEDTLRDSDHDGAVLHPTEWIAQLLKDHRIDVWLCGHEHGPKRDRRQIRRIGRTMFINVASLSHAYGTQACNSFMFRMTAGTRRVEALCRHHDRERYVPRLGTEFELPHPVRFQRQPEIVDVLPRSAYNPSRVHKPDENV
jgi:predicted MPP superfamily phosphohydrolase